VRVLPGVEASRPGLEVVQWRMNFRPANYQELL